MFPDFSYESYFKTCMTKNRNDLLGYMVQYRICIPKWTTVPKSIYQPKMSQETLLFGTIWIFSLA